MEQLKFKDWNIEALTGYEPKTTFYTDFSIADHFGINAIQDTAKRAFQGWNYDVEYMTELVMVLNWKIWEHYETNKTIARVYEALYMKFDQWCVDNFKGDELKYYLTTID